MRKAAFFLALVGICTASWSRVARAASEETHTVAFALHPAEGAVEKGHIIAAELHDPDHPNFQNWLSLEEVEDLFINREAVNRVRAHLETNGYEVETRGDFLWATSTVQNMEAHLSAEFHHYAHPHVSDTVKKTDIFTIPSEIADDVSIVLNLNHLPKVKTPAPATPSGKRAGKGYVDLDVLQTIYGVPRDLLNAPSTKQMIIGQGVVQSDLVQFFRTYNSSLKSRGSNLPITRYGVDDTAFCTDPSHDCGEPTLDMQYSMGMAPGVQTILYNVKGDGLGQMYNYLASTQDPPKVSSSSLGTGPDRDYDIRICAEIQKSTLRGTTSFSASGDGGAFGNQCSVNNDYPTNCPYITGVGGTQGPENGAPESVWDHSGISLAQGIFDIPAWQKAPLNAYVQKYKGQLPPASKWNPSAGRVSPDVAAVASILPLVAHGKVGYAAGTSFASPIWAGITSNLVARRNGKGVGAIHITIANLAAKNNNPLKDITTGSVKNAPCGTFPAAPGWDIGTGYGSPIWKKLTTI